MTRTTLLTETELGRLDTAIEAMTDLRARTGVLLLRHGIRPQDIVRAPRAGYDACEIGYPPQVSYPTAMGMETTILTPSAGATVAAYLRTHDHHLLLPGMTVERLRQILDDRMNQAGMLLVSPSTLRLSVRCHTGEEQEV